MTVTVGAVVVTAGADLAPVGGGLPEGCPHPAAVYVAGLSQGSRRAIARSLDLLVEVFMAVAGGPAPYRGVGLSFPWWNLRYSHTSAIRSRLQEQVAPATANKALSALRRVLKESWRLGLMSVEDYQRAADLPNVAGASLPAGRDVSQGEISALMAACTAGDANLDYRDGAVLAIMLVGLRRSEVAGLALGDVSLDDGRLVVRRAKRNKQRAVYLPLGAVAAVRDWLSRRGDAPGPLFLPINKGDRIIHKDKPLTPQAIQVILERRAVAAGVSGCSPHDFRRTFVGNLLDAGVDLATVQGLVGHASPTTTARYDRRPDAVKAAAVAKLHVPYSRR